MKAIHRVLSGVVIFGLLGFGASLPALEKETTFEFKYGEMRTPQRHLKSVHISKTNPYKRPFAEPITVRYADEQQVFGSTTAKWSRDGRNVD